MLDVSNKNDNTPTDNHCVVMSEETVSPKGWVSLGRSQSSKFVRKRVVELYVKANGFSDAHQLIEAIRAKKVNIYTTAKKLLAVELTVVVGIELAGNYWAGIVYFLTFVLLEGPFFVFLLYRTGRRYKTKLRKVNSLIKKEEAKEALGDFENLMKKEKPESKGLILRVFRFGLSCAALSAILFGIQYIILYDQSVINGNTSTYVTTTVKSLSSWVDWTAGVFIAVFFGGLMIGALILVIPWNMLERIAAIRRGKKLIGL